MLQDRFAPLAVRPPIELAVAAVARSPASAREKYLRDWKVVKRARFNAAKRFESKQSASTLAFALAGVIGFLLPFYTMLFVDALSSHTKNVLDFTAYVTGALSLMVGLIEQAKDYPAKARRFDQCGRRVNVLVRRLTLFVRHDQDLYALIEDYEKALEECGENHDGIDYDIALAQQQLEDAVDKDWAKRRLARLKLIESATIYWLYTAIWVLPALVGVLLWWSLYPGAAVH
jgi:SMODS and SLOG-associating 2TM effector domain family 5